MTATLPQHSAATIARARGRLIDTQGRILQPRLCNGSGAYPVSSVEGPWWTACDGCSACEPVVFCAAILRPALTRNPFPQLADDERF